MFFGSAVRQSAVSILGCFSPYSKVLGRLCQNHGIIMYLFFHGKNLREFFSKVRMDIRYYIHGFA